ncbi:TPA: hypothetical protein JLU53_004403 [Escherichia coli]|nr:hypothetical protein [Escherichia coli]
MNQCTQWLGYHGTSVLCANSIINTNFNVSRQENDWLGTGAYFFIESPGLLAPEEKAAQWANIRASNARPNYTNLAVLEATIEVEQYLDLDNDEHIAALNKVREVYMEIMKSEGKKPTGNRLFDKCCFCNYLMHEHGIDALIRKEYIKTTREELDYGFEGGVPNCRVLCVKDPKASVKSIRFAVERRRVR